MVCEKLSMVFDFIGATNNVIAQYSGIDASLVSRIKSGSRTVKMNSVSITKIADGIYMFCDDRNIIASFCSIFGGSPSNSREDTVKEFIIWLFEGAEKPDADYAPKRKPAPFSDMSSKLDKMMRLTDISNIRLARTTNVDSSYISRIRNGLRTPKSNIELIRNISSALADRIAEQNKFKEAAKLMTLPEELIAGNSVLREELFRWLCDTDSESLFPAAEMLLDRIEAFSPDTRLPMPDIPAIMSEANGDTTPLYRGTDGIRRAVIRFLSDAAKNGKNELWLYSDQSMEWMVGDDEFRLKWFALMAECAKKGVKIKIIHNIDRSISEMMAAITSWLPLYMSGVIEPFYCAKNTDERFSHTLFLCRGKVCINACHVRGHEDNGYYEYCTDGEKLSFFAAEYRDLLKASKPLVRLYSDDSVMTALNESSSEDESIVRESLSLATMPKKLLLSILDRAGITGVERERITENYKIQKNHFEAALKSGYVHELIPIIRNGRIFADIADGICYTPSELTAHIKNILRLMDKYANYRVYILPEAPFANMCVMTDNNRVMVLKTKNPRISFVFTHPLMLNAFQNYIAHLKSTCEQDKNTARNILKQHVNKKSA